MTHTGTWFGALCVLSLVACTGGTDSPPPPPMPPVVSSMSPLSGPYGTTVTITGEHFGDTPLDNALDVDGVRNATVTAWSDTEITFRFPFPATGDVSVRTAGGTAEAGTFTPDAPPFGVGSNLGSIPVAAAVMGNGSVGAVLLTGVSYPNASVTITSLAGNVAHYPLDQPLTEYTLLNAFEAAPNTFEAVFFGPFRALYFLSWDEAGDLTFRNTAITPPAALAAGRDDTGTLVWAMTETGTLARYRAPATSADPWTSDLNLAIPFTVEKPTHALRGALASDGTLFATWGRFSGTLVNDEAVPTFSRVVPSPLSWIDEPLSPEVNDSVISSEMLISPDGARVFSRYCYTNQTFDPYDPLDPDTTRSCVGPLDLGDTTTPGSLHATPQLNALTAEGLIQVSGTEEEGYTLETLSDSVELAVWPQRPLWVLHHETHGTFVLVGGNGTYVLHFAP